MQHRSNCLLLICLHERQRSKSIPDNDEVCQTILRGGGDVQLSFTNMGQNVKHLDRFNNFIQYVKLKNDHYI